VAVFDIYVGVSTTYRTVAVRLGRLGQRHVCTLIKRTVKKLFVFSITRTLKSHVGSKPKIDMWLFLDNPSTEDGPSWAVVLNWRLCARLALAPVFTPTHEMHTPSTYFFCLLLGLESNELEHLRSALSVLEKRIV